MMDLQRRALGILVVIMAPLLAQALEPVQIKLQQPSDAGQQKALAVFGRIVKERTGLDVTATTNAPLMLGFRTDIGAEGFSIEDGPDKTIKVSGHGLPGLMAGVGKLLCTAHMEHGFFQPGTWRGVSLPKMPVRGMYLATHFHNYYEKASQTEIDTLLEDLALWGCNDLMFNYPIQQFSDMSEKKSLETFARLRRVVEMGKRLGMRTTLVQVPSQNIYGTPPAAKATQIPGVYMFGPELCPSTLAGSALIERNAKHILKQFDQVDTLVTWPYDDGGCGCSKCMPWGGNGFLRASKIWAEVFHDRFPKGKLILSTWWFARSCIPAIRDDFKALLFYMGKESPLWFQGLLTGESEHNIQLPLLNRPNPTAYPLTCFPDIAMHDMTPWGGCGANPLPAFNAKYSQQVKGLVEGSWPYSEGIYDDVNKYYWIRHCWNPEQSMDDILKEYASYYFSPDVASDAVRLFRLLEKTAPRRDLNFQRLDEADTAWTLANSMDTRLPTWSRKSWRWRILLIRAGIDHTVNEFGLVNPKARKALNAYADELQALYHVNEATAPSLRPLRFPAVGKPTNIALGQRVLASSAHPEHGPSVLTDGITGAQIEHLFWINNPAKDAFPQITIDLKRKSAISSIVLHCRVRDKRCFCVPRSVKVEISMDGITFNPASILCAEMPEPISIFHEFPPEGALLGNGACVFNLNQNARYVRLIFGVSGYKGVQDTGCVGLSEVQVMSQVE